MSRRSVFLRDSLTVLNDLRQRIDEGERLHPAQAHAVRPRLAVLRTTLRELDELRRQVTQMTDDAFDQRFPIELLQ